MLYLSEAAPDALRLAKCRRALRMTLAAGTHPSCTEQGREVGTLTRERSSFADGRTRVKCHYEMRLPPPQPSSGRRRVRGIAPASKSIGEETLYKAWS